MTETPGMGMTETRIGELERKITNMDALVRGLTSELIGLKSDIMTMSKEAEENSRRELRREITGRRTVTPVPEVRPSAAEPVETVTITRVESPARQEAPAAKSDEPEMVMIMQPDGTMKMEPRHGDAKQMHPSGNYEKGQIARFSRPGK
jgi:hypothetical protein